MDTSVSPRLVSKTQSNSTRPIEEDEELSEPSDVSETEEGESPQGEANDGEGSVDSGDDTDSAVQAIIEAAHSQAAQPLFRPASEASDIKEIFVQGSGMKRKSTTDTHSSGNKSPASQKRRKGIEAVNTSASTSTPESSSGDDDDDDDALNPLPSTPELERYFQSIRKLHYSAKIEANDRTKQTILHQTRRITSLKKQLKAAEYEAQVQQVKREDAEAELKELKEKIKRFMKGLGV